MVVDGVQIYVVICNLLLLWQVGTVSQWATLATLPPSSPSLLLSCLIYLAPALEKGTQPLTAAAGRYHTRQHLPHSPFLLLVSC